MRHAKVFFDLAGEVRIVDRILESLDSKVQEAAEDGRFSYLVTFDNVGPEAAAWQHVIHKLIDLGFDVALSGLSGQRMTYRISWENF